MGRWIVAPREVHHHDFPDIIGYKIDDVIGTKWQCSCGAKFKFRKEYVEWGTGKTLSGKWERIKEFYR